MLFTIPSLYVYVVTNVYSVYKCTLKTLMHAPPSSGLRTLTHPSFPSTACERYPILFRTYVSRPSAGKGRAVLEGVGLAPETIRACYGRHPLEEEEAVQDGLIKWAEGHHGYSRTWSVVLNAMEYAGVAQHHCQGLRKELYQKLAGMCACVCVCVYTSYNYYMQYY